MSAVRTFETNRGTSRREEFWFIVAARSEDEAEIRADIGTVGHDAGHVPEMMLEGMKAGRSRLPTKRAKVLRP
ncbi:hypothetical protein QV13_14230 [Mesorhizobium hungaricum]|jgi:hypothetical protein|uniref:Uncharacterized protein n=1 Tax=Mesorhizobium hungaricum TaxID=1566387 RepID=A0A1C2DMR0_9HYPH|nr:hypothetical protein QV13_14230 [Mesorhizobium hungaricum]